MKERINTLFKAVVAWPWLAVAAGGCVLLSSLVYVPGDWDALGYFDPPKRLLWSLMGLVLAGAWGIQRNRLARIPLLLSFALLSWIVIRTLFKPRPDVELEVLFTWMLPLLLFILAGGLDQVRGIRVLGGFLVVAGLAQASLMLLQRFGYDPFLFDATSVMDYKPGRMIGTIGYQNQAVDFLALSGVGILLVSRSRFLRLVFMLAMLVVAGLTGNRAGIIAFTLAILVSQVLSMPLWDGGPPPVVRKTRSRWRVAALVTLGACGVVGTMALMPETASRFRELFTETGHSPAVRSRVLMARVGVAMFRERPWTGWGAGEYAFQYLDRLAAILPAEKTHDILGSVVFAREAHNDHLQFAAEFGLVGVLLVTALLAVAVARAWRARNRGSSVTPAMAFILAYMAVASSFSFPWQTSMGGPLAGLLLGWLWPANGDRETAPAELQGRVRPASGARLAKGLLVVLTIMTMGWFAVDAGLNTEVPDVLTWYGPSEAAKLLPRYAYRYRALVGASYATLTIPGADVLAARELAAAERGYRDIPLWNNIGHVKVRMNRWDEAREVYERWERCGLDHSEALMNLSIAYEQSGRLQQAADTLVKRNRLWPDPSPSEIKRLAVLQLQSGNPKGAQATLRLYHRKWKATDSKTAAEIENLAGGICLVLGETEEAAKWFRSALDKNPDLKSARRNLEGLSTRLPGDRP
jgi:O-antigen ligase/Flp pilus assembly protein TadD